MSWDWEEEKLNDQRARALRLILLMLIILAPITYFGYQDWQRSRVFTFTGELTTTACWLTYLAAPHVGSSHEEGCGSKTWSWQDLSMGISVNSNTKNATLSLRILREGAVCMEKTVTGNFYPIVSGYCMNH